MTYLWGIIAFLPAGAVILSLINQVRANRRRGRALRHGLTFPATSLDTDTTPPMTWYAYRAMERIRRHG